MPDWFNLIVDEIGEVAAYMKSNVKRLAHCRMLKMMLSSLL